MRTRIALLALALFSATAVAQADTKILSVRYGELVRESAQYKAAETKMKAEFEKRGADLEAQRKAFAEDYKNYQRDADTLSADQRLKKEKDLKSRDADLSYAQRKFQEDLQTRDRELTQDMVGKIDVAIAQVAKEKGADLVIKDALVINPASDVTAEVLKRLNAGAAAK
jgi:outer membrane protein